MERRTIYAYAIRLAVIAAAPHLMNAQALKVECFGGDLKEPCSGRVSVADSLQQALIVLRVTRDGKIMPGAIVRFRATAGNVHPESTSTDSSGHARAVWFRSKGADPVAVVAEARAGSASGLASIHLTPDTIPSPSRTIALVESSGFTQSWFEKSQLPRTVEVELREAGANGSTVPITDRAACAAHRVLFTRRGAPSTVSPDTAVATVYDDRCYAWTYWALGEGIGERELDVRALPGKGFKAGESLEANAWARASPRFVAGFARSRLRPYLGLNPASKRTVRVEVVDASGVKRSYDTTETTGTPSIERVGGRIEFGAVAAVSVPIPIAALGDLDGLSFTGGADLANPTDRLFAGFSVIRLFGKLNPVIESLPVDFHMLGLWARQPELKDPTCEPDACTVQKRRRYQGISWMVTADATTLISELVKKLAP